MYSIQSKKALLSFLVDNNNTNYGVIIHNHQCYCFHISNFQVIFEGIAWSLDKPLNVETKYLIIKDCQYIETFKHCIINTEQMTFLKSLPFYNASQIKDISNVEVEEGHQYQIIDFYCIN